MGKDAARQKFLIFFGFVIFVSHQTDYFCFKRLIPNMLQFMEGTHLEYTFTMYLGTSGLKVVCEATLWVFYL